MTTTTSPKIPASGEYVQGQAPLPSWNEGPTKQSILDFVRGAVATYFSQHRGEHYSPHVTIGVGTVDYLNALLAAPFPTFTFSVVGMSAYQFGNFGTAAKQLHSFKVTQ